MRAAPINARSILETALAYGKRGLKILPLHSIENHYCTCAKRGPCGRPGKHPRTHHGVRDATTGEATIRQWWRKWPDANIGLATGAGIAVIDVDRHDADGYRTLAGLEAKHGQLPPTAEVATGGGGRHLFFRTCGPVRSRDIGHGVELKAEGGYVVAPPSRHLKGPYTWVRELPEDLNELPELPSWVANCKPRTDPKTHTHSRRRSSRASGALPPWLPEHIAVGTRHRTFQRLAGWLRGIGYDEPAILAVLLEIREQRCELPSGDAVDDQWLAQLARAMARKPVGRGAASLYERFHAVISRWQGRTANTDRRVLLTAVLPMSLRAALKTLPLAVRTVALLARVAPATAGRALLRLAQDRGVLTAVASAKPPKAAVYRLNVPSAPSRRDTLHDRSSKHRSYQRSVSQRDKDAFRWGALGWVAQRVYETLGVGKGRSVAQLHTVTGDARSSIYLALKRLAQRSLAVRAADGWRRGNGSLATAAEHYGVLGKYERERARFWDERLNHRSPEGRRRRRVAHERHLGMARQVLALAASHAFPALDRVEAGEQSWQTLVRRARPKTLLRILHLLQQRRLPTHRIDRATRKVAASRLKG